MKSGGLRLGAVELRPINAVMMSAQARCPHEAAGRKRHTCDEERSLQPRQCPIMTHACASIVGLSRNHDVLDQLTNG